MADSRVKNTLHEMMRARDYMDAQYMFEDEDNNIVFLKSDEATLVTFEDSMLPDAFKNSFIKTFKGVEKKLTKIVAEFDERKTIQKTVFIFVVNQIHPGLFDIIKKLKTPTSPFIQIFKRDTLLYNVTKSNLVPVHIRIGDKNTYDDILNEFNIQSIHNLPKILLNDPVAKFIGLREGEICKIKRKYSDAYRLCIDESDKSMKLPR